MEANEEAGWPVRRDISVLAPAEEPAEGPNCDPGRLCWKYVESN
jgi:hypothetical protein